MTVVVREPARSGGSPLIPPAEVAAYGEFGAPVAHTSRELGVLVRLLEEGQGRFGPVGSVVVGHSRDAVSRAAGAAFSAAWCERGGVVLDVVDWPERAASWLRAARRFTEGVPDAWVVAAAPLGWAQMSRRLRHSTDWDPARTVGFASLADSRLPALAGAAALHGMRGATAEGGTWAVDRGWLTRSPVAGWRGTRGGGAR